MIVDQQHNDSLWVPVGSYAMAPGAGHKVVLANNADAYVIADAVKFESDPSPSAEIIVDNGEATATRT